jgi:ABC-type multidrug transport system fused ATPase/permease subunit
MVLKEINFSIQQGEFIAVVGKVGTGKTSLLNVMIENLRCIPLEDSSSVRVSGSVGYFNQTPWLLNATIRDNITFGAPFQIAKY